LLEFLFYSHHLCSS